MDAGPTWRVRGSSPRERSRGDPSPCPIVPAPGRAVSPAVTQARLGGLGGIRVKARSRAYRVEPGLARPRAGTQSSARRGHGSAWGVWVPAPEQGQCSARLNLGWRDPALGRAVSPAVTQARLGGLGGWFVPPRREYEPVMCARSAHMGRLPARGAKGTRTPDTWHAKPVLFQLSYSPGWHPEYRKPGRGAPSVQCGHAGRRASCRGCNFD